MAVSISGRFAPLSETLIIVPLTVNASDGSSIPDRKGLATWWVQTGRDSTLAHATRGGIGKGATAPLAGAGVQWAGTASATTAGEAAGIDFIRTRLCGTERFFAPFLAKTFQGAPPRFATAWAALDEFIDPPPEQRDDVLGQDLISRDEVERLQRHHRSLYEVMDSNAVLRFKDWGGQVRPLSAESPWLEYLDGLEAEARSHQRMHDAASQGRILAQDRRRVFTGNIDADYLQRFKCHPIVRSVPWLQDSANQSKFLATTTWRDIPAVEPDADDEEDDGTPAVPGARNVFLDAHRCYQNNQSILAEAAKASGGQSIYSLGSGGILPGRAAPDAIHQNDQGGVDRVPVTNVPVTSVRQLSRPGVRGHENRDPRSAPHQDAKPTTTMPRNGCKHFWCVPGAICPDGPNSRADADGKILGQYCGKVHGRPDQRGSVHFRAFKAPPERRSQPPRRYHRHADSHRPAVDTKPRLGANRHGGYRRGDRPPVQRKVKGEIRCYGCGELGHIRPRCPKADPDLEVARTIRAIKADHDRQDRVDEIAETINRARSTRTKTRTNDFKFGKLGMVLTLVAVGGMIDLGMSQNSSHDGLLVQNVVKTVVQVKCDGVFEEDRLKIHQTFGFILAMGVAAIIILVTGVQVRRLSRRLTPHTYFKTILSKFIASKTHHQVKPTNSTTVRVCMIKITTLVNGLYRDGHRARGSDSSEAKRQRTVSVIQACFDSGASGHCCSEESLFRHIRYYDTPKQVTDAGGTQHNIIGVGDIPMMCCTTDGNEQLVTLQDVALAPTLTEGLYVDTTRLRTRHGWTCVGNRKKMQWRCDKGFMFNLSVRDGLEYLDGKPAAHMHQAQLYAIGQGGRVSKVFTDKISKMSDHELEEWAVNDQSLNRWQVNRIAIRMAKAGRLLLTNDRSIVLKYHHLLAGSSWRVLAKYCRNHKIPLSQTENLWAQTVGASRQRRRRRGKRLEQDTGDKRVRWSVDIAGPFPTSTHHSRKHLLVWVEHFSRTIWSRPLSHLRDIPLAIAEWADKLRTEQTGAGKVTDLVINSSIDLHGDGASYFISQSARATYRAHRITWSNSPPHQQWRNAHAERAIQTLMQHIKALLHGGSVPQGNWPEAAAFATLVYNDLPCMANQEQHTPNEVRTGGRSPDIMGIYLPFGARATVHIPAQQRDGKLGRVARNALVLGWDTTAKAPVIEITTRTGRSMLRVSNELSVDPLLPTTVYDIPGAKLPEPTTMHGTTRVEGVHANTNAPHKEEDGSAPWVVIPEESDEESDDEQPQGLDVPEDGEIEVFDDHYVVHALTSVRDKTRYSLSAQIRAYPQHSKAILKGTQDEVTGLVARCLVPVSEETVGTDHVATLISMWTVKRDVAGEINRFKCRSVYPGQNEIIGQDYWMSRSDVPKVTSIRVHLALSPFPDEENRTFDVGQAYTLAELEEDVPANDKRYIKFNDQVSPRDPQTGRPQLYRVTRGIYGMKAAGRQWQLLFFGWMGQLGFTQSVFDPAMFFFPRSAPRDRQIRIAIWVDDVVARGTPQAMAWFRQAMTERFGDIKEGPLRWVLGMKVVTGHDGYLGVNSAPWITRIREQQNIPPSKHKIPLPASLRITKDDRVPVTDPSVKAAYLQVLGQLGYLSNWTVPYLSYPVSMLSSVAASPSQGHLKIARRVLAFTCSHPDLGLQYRDPTSTANPAGDSGFTDVIEIYTDSGWAQEDCYVSQSGFIAWMNGSAVGWGSKKQPFPALSSTEAEIIGGCEALRVALTLKSFLEEMGFTQGLVRFYFDAQNAIRFNVEERIRPRSHHIGVRYHRCRHEVGKNITIEFIRSEDELGDLCTKNTEFEQFQRLVGRIMTELRDVSPEPNDNPLKHTEQTK